MVDLCYNASTYPNKEVCMTSPIKFTVTVELAHVSGPEQDEETMLDYFAGTLGQQNAAKHPLHLTVPQDGGVEFGGTESVYFVKQVDVP